MTEGLNSEFGIVRAEKYRVNWKRVFEFRRIDEALPEEIILSESKTGRTATVQKAMTIKVLLLRSLKDGWIPAFDRYG